MVKTEEEQRAYAKTRRAQLLHTLQNEFDLAPRIAQAVLEEAEECLCQANASGQDGQRRVVLASRAASHGQSLNETATKQVNRTLAACRRGFSLRTHSVLGTMRIVFEDYCRIAELFAKSPTI